MTVKALRLARSAGDTSDERVATIREDLVSDHRARQGRLWARLVGALKYGVVGAVAAALLEGGVIGGFLLGYGVGALLGVHLDRQLASVLRRR